MKKRSLFRKSVITLAMLVGLFSQFQAVFACELMGGETKSVCCCDEPSGMSDMSSGCDMGGGCQGRTGPVSSPSDCCQVSYEPVPSAAAIAPEFHAQQVLLLVAPQPPPLPATFILPDFASNRTSLRFNHPRSLPVTGTHTYLLTNRFRI